MILVVGGGFGLYGHVAALAGAGRELATLTEYRARANVRPELDSLLLHVHWVDDVMAAARDADTVVLARTPGQNAELARALIAAGTGGTLIIEKPVAETPTTAAALESELADAGRRWAIPYLFAECDWAGAARAELAAGKSVEIDWAHCQSPNVRGWKREADAGGGAVAFYFIHFIALAETLMPGSEPVFAVLHGDGGAVTGCSLREVGYLTLRFSLGDVSHFTVCVDGEPIHETATPFGPTPVAGAPDPRIPMLATFHQRVSTDPQFQPPAFHAAITRHWAALEAIVRA